MGVVCAFVNICTRKTIPSVARAAGTCETAISVGTCGLRNAVMSVQRTLIVVGASQSITRITRVTRTTKIQTSIFML